MKPSRIPANAQKVKSKDFTVANTLQWVIPNIVPCELVSTSTLVVGPDMSEYHLPKSVLAYLKEKPIHVLEIETFTDYETGHTECTVKVKHGRTRYFLGYATLSDGDTFSLYTGINIAVLRAMAAVIEYYK